MPSVLTELGFLTNGGDRAVLTTRKGQERLARSLFNAFSMYKTKVEGKNSYKEVSVSDIDSVKEQDSAASSAPSGGQNLSENVKKNGASDNVVSKSNASVKGNVIFRIQVCSSVKRIPLNDPTFKSYRNRVEERHIGGRYKYYVCPTSSYDEAVALQSSVRRTFKDAFIVAFKNDKIVPVSSVRK